MGVTVPKLQAPEGSKVTFKVEITSEFNISSFVARQKANRFLIMNVGDLLHAGERELVISDVVRWRVPVVFSTLERGRLGKVGELLVDADTGEVTVEEPMLLEEIMRNAEVLYRSTAGVGIG